MKLKLYFMLIVLSIFPVPCVLGKVTRVDLFKECLDRTGLDRVDCESGCGMIIQQCRDEAVEDINNKIMKAKKMIRQKNGLACANFVDEYLKSALRMEAELQDRTSNLPGWAGSELTLSFARQRLENVRALLESCKQ